MTASTSACPGCGEPASGKFCSSCGTALQCPSCGAPVPRGSRFCSSCGKAAAPGTATTKAERTPWIIAGVALAGLLAAVLVMVARQSPGVSPAAGVAPVSASQTGAPAPDISNMTPRERFNRLYNRVMQAAQSGDEATVSRFTPMALAAYAGLDTIDSDARYHAALLKVHTGNVAESRALADTILSADPGHLFGYVVRGTVARFQKDQKELSRAYSGFLKRYEAEMKLNRPEYSEHQTSLNDFRKAALAAPAGGGS
jgi:Double zinc ribbon